MNFKTCHEKWNYGSCIFFISLPCKDYECKIIYKKMLFVATSLCSLELKLFYTMVEEKYISLSNVYHYCDAIKWTLRNIIEPSQGFVQ